MMLQVGNRGGCRVHPNPNNNVSIGHIIRGEVVMVIKRQELMSYVLTSLGPGWVRNIYMDPLR